MAAGLDGAISKINSLIAEANNGARNVATSAAPSGDATTSGRLPSLMEEMKTLCTQALQTAFPGVDVPVIVTQATNPKFGDYQCNNAMSLFSKLKGKEGAPKNPRSVGEAIAAAIPEHPAVASTSIAGPGFVNIVLREEYLAGRVNGMMQNGISSWAPPVQAGKVVVDFSSPNVAKEMHVGHLRSTILGDTLCKLLEFSGCEVVRLNHVGDWGTQFGMLIQHMAERPGGMGNGEEDISALQDLYKASKLRFDAEEDFKTRARAAVTKLQGGDKEMLAAWKLLCEISRREFDKIYQRLEVDINERGESFYNPMLEGVVKDLVDRGIAEDSDGAKVIHNKGISFPLMIQKSDGGYGYGTTDMAAITHRVQTEKADWIIYITDAGQADHFKLVFASARRAGILPASEDEAPRVSHVGFGLVLGDDGKRFRTRSSEVVRLVDLLDEAKNRVRKTISDRRAASGETISEEELEAAACAMGYGSVKYADLKNQRMTNYKFDFDDMLNLQGNTAVYLLYAHARIAGIIRKAGVDVAEVAKRGDIRVVDPKERLVALHLAQFPEAVATAIDELAPHRLTEYLYYLTDKFNSFYTDCKVVGTPEQDSRLLLCEATAVTMRQCFALLGLKPLYRI